MRNSKRSSASREVVSARESMTAITGSQNFHPTNISRCRNIIPAESSAVNNYFFLPPSLHAGMGAQSDGRRCQQADAGADTNGRRRPKSVSEEADLKTSQRRR